MNALDIERTAADWLVKRTSGTWTDQQQTELEAWIDASLAHRIAYVRLETVWHQSGRLQALGAATTPGQVPPRGTWLDTASLPIVLPSEQRDERRFWTLAAPSRRHIAAAASIVVLLLAASFAGYALWPAGERYTTRIGAIDTVPLTDGSRVTLNTDTRLRVALKPSERLIELDKGEAYFEVAKDPARPFIVRVAGRRVIAVGTKFSVRRDRNDIQVIVTEGAVRLEVAADAREAQNSQGSAGELVTEGAIALSRAGSVIVQQESTEQLQDHLSWRSGYLVFRETLLAEAVAEFNRYNRRKIVIEDPAIARIEVGGNFKSDSIDVFLWMLQTAFPIDVDTDAEDIVLRSR